MEKERVEGGLRVRSPGVTPLQHAAQRLAHVWEVEVETKTHTRGSIQELPIMQIGLAINFVGIPLNSKMPHVDRSPQSEKRLF